MSRYRLFGPARADIAAILRRSDERHGREARVRYRGCLAAAMRRVAADPVGGATVDRAELVPGIRIFHLRYSRDESREAPLANPVHVIFCRVTRIAPLSRTSRHPTR